MFIIYHVKIKLLRTFIIYLEHASLIDRQSDPGYGSKKQ